MKEINVNTEYITLCSFLKWCAAAETGGEANMAVKGGEVKVNGEVCLMRGKKLRPGDRVEYKSEKYMVVASGDIKNA